MIFPAKHISVSINRSPKDVYDFAANPENLTKWAAGLANAALSRSGDWWVTMSSMGEVKVKFVHGNVYGVMDHDVVLPSGDINHNPFRVVKNGDGSEVIFTLYRTPQMTDAEFDRDAEMVGKDLLKLKTILET